jgi:hypothetical protein
MEPWPPGFTYDFDVVFPLSPLHRQEDLPTLLRRPIDHAWPTFRTGVRSAPNSSLPHRRGRRSPPQSGVRMTGGGRSTTSRLVSTVFWTEAHQGRAGAPPIGLHGWDRVCHAKRKEDGAQAVAAVVVAQSGDDSSIVAGRRRTAAAAKQRRRRPSSGSGGVWGRLGYKP